MDTFLLFLFPVSLYINEAGGTNLTVKHDWSSGQTKLEPKLLYQSAGTNHVTVKVVSPNSLTHRNQ